MELKDQVCSLESAKRLKELGVKQDSSYVWRKNEPSMDRPTNEYSLHFTMKPKLDDFSAFTVAELGEMLPDNVIGTLRLNGGEHSTGIRFENSEYKVFRNKNEAEARAKMLIYLLENDLIKLNGG